jgi:hypothetical protein
VESTTLLKRRTDRGLKPGGACAVPTLAAMWIRAMILGSACPALGLALSAVLLGACGPSSFRDISGAATEAGPGKTPDAGTGRDGFAPSGTDTEIQIDPGAGAGPDSDAAATGPALGSDATASTPALPVGPAGPDAGGAEIDAGKKNAGSPCAAADQCGSGFCSDGVCCDSACTDRCHVCNAAGSVGRCIAAVAGDDPRDECATDLVSTCGRDGTCDGAGGCRLYPSKTECEPGGCVGTTSERAARLCDGKGVCQATTSRSCTSSTCQNGSCASACASDDVCLPGFHCENQTCKLKRPLGQTCTSAAGCASGVCSGGVCCNIACDGKICSSCTVPGKVGTCSPAPAGQDPGDLCPTEAATTCGRDGVCDGTGRCRLHAAGVECGAAVCSNGAAESARTCDGKGSCQASTRSACGAFACNGASCATTCAAPATGCAPGFVCKGAACASDGLLLYWKFDEDDGIRAIDSSGNGIGNDGMYIGPPTPSAFLPPLKFTNPHSRAFEAAKRQAAVIAVLPAQLKPAALTLSVWYQSKGIPAGKKGAELISLGNNQLLRLLPTGFEVSKRIKKGAGFAYVRCFSAPARTDHLDGKWHHLATVIDVDSFRIFFDGVQVCTAASADPLGYDIAGSFTAGRHGEMEDTYDLDGNLDDLRVYGRALSTVEIMSLAAGGI